jgi:uncharacterized membrane protein YsdA (DUF1294 family)
MVSPAALAMALIALNCLAFAAFGVDKWRARRGRWRVRESTLLWLALLGGSPGAWAGRRVFRHKMRKQPFVGRLRAIGVMQVVAVAGFAWWRAGG